MRARIDISEVETRTKIRAKYLRAIENEEWDLLPGPVYVKSFLRTYGDYLGLDSRLLIDEFRRRYERPSDHDLRPMSAVRRDRERASRGPLIPPRVIIGGVLLLVVVALYVIGAGSSNPSKPNPTGSGGSVPRHRTGSTTTPPPTTATQTKTTPPAAAEARMQLIPTGPVYVCVEDVHHRKLINGVTYQAGQTVPIEARRELLLTLGNNQVQLKVNGKLVPVSASTTAIGLRVRADGVTHLTAAQAPTCA